MSHSEPFEFFPFNMSSGPAFLGFYLLLSAFGVVAAIELRRRAAAWLERREAQALLAATAAPTGGPYRGWGAPPQSSLLAIGSIPRQDDRWAVAYLRAGAAALADTLLAVAFAEGWLVPSDKAEGLVKLAAGSPPHDRLLADLRERLAATGREQWLTSDLRTIALAVAGHAEADILRTLERSGMLRSAGTRTRATAVVGLVACLVLAVGGIRAARGVALGRPVSLLLSEMILAAGGFVMAEILIRGKESQAPYSVLRQDYLGWLEDATVSLCADVRRGRRRDAADVGLAVAIAGAAVLSMSPDLTRMYRAIAPLPAIVPPLSALAGSSSVSHDARSTCSSVESCSSSSCSSGGCSSGGGDGGTGCGG